MDSIYDEMYSRNVDWLTKNPAISDPLLLSPHEDMRKCIALVTKNDVELLDMTEINKICSPLSCRWMRPKVHSTFMVLRGWKDTLYDLNIDKNWNVLRDIIQNNIQPYEIIFDRVIPVKTGLVLCGSATLDINSIRDKIRDAGYETDVLYKCNIVHTTLLRWTYPLTWCEQEEWLNKIISMPRKPYARISVTGFDIIISSWSMHPGTTQIIDSIDLETDHER